MWPLFASVRPQFYRQNRNTPVKHLKKYNILTNCSLPGFGNNLLVFSTNLPHFQLFQVLLFPKKQPERRILTVASTTKFHGGLFYYGTPSSALAKCSCIIADMLEEYGHSVDQFSARADDAIALASDQYRLVLRMAEKPKVPNGAKLRPNLQKVEISLQPNFPSYCDKELSEMLMAVMLYRLVNELGAEYIEWMDTSVTLTRKQFLGVFAKIRPLHPQPKISGSDRFAPIEETAIELELHCAQIQKSPYHPAVQVTKPVPYQRLATWAGSLMRSHELRVVSPIPPLTTFALLLHSSGVI